METINKEYNNSDWKFLPINI